MCPYAGTTLIKWMYMQATGYSKLASESILAWVKTRTIADR